MSNQRYFLGIDVGTGSARRYFHRRGQDVGIVQPGDQDVRVNHADKVVEPARDAVSTCHNRKYRVFHRLHADAQAYRKEMAAV